MKTVGIFTRIDNFNNKEIHYVPSDVFYKLKNNVNVIFIPFGIEDTFDSIVDSLNFCDGIILPGGDDIYPIEIDVCKYLYEKNIPLLGICLGMQTMACAMGGLLDRLPNLNHKTNEIYAHKVKIKRDTKLYNLIRKKEIIVNSRHKDYVATCSSLKVSAKSDDGIIEAIEAKNKTFFIGVQWHPENLEDENSKRLFKYFINVL